MDGRKTHKRLILIYLGLFLLLLVWQWNGIVDHLGYGFDVGVQNMEQYVAYDNTLHYGKDLVGTPYPPLAWLYKGVSPALTKSYGLAVYRMIAINVFSASLKVIVIALFWKEAKSVYAKLIASLATFLVFTEFSVGNGFYQNDICILAVSLLICRLHVVLRDNDRVKKEGAAPANEKRRLSSLARWDELLLIAFIALLISVPQMTKFSYFAMSLAVIVIMAVMLIVRKRYLSFGMFFSIYCLSSMMLWVVTGEKLSYLIPFVRDSLGFAGNYSEMMALGFGTIDGKNYTFPYFVFMVGVCCVYAGVLIYLFVRHRFYSVSWFIIAPFIFLSFKECFTRSDPQHAKWCVHTLFYILCHLMYVLKELDREIQGKVQGITLNKYFWPAMLCVLLIPSITSNKWLPTATLYSDFKAIGTEERFLERVENDKKDVRERDDYVALYEDIQDYPTQTFGMLSGEQTFFLAYDLMDRFKLSPIISLWEMTRGEDELTVASQYREDEAPDILIYRPEPLSGDYYVFRMGTILQALLENYQLDKVGANSYLFLRNSGQNNSSTSYEIDEPKTVKVGEAIEIPKVENAYVFMKVDWDITPLGTLAKLLFKPTENRVEITTEGGGVHSYRFHRTLAENGIYVSSWADNAKKLAALFSGNTITDSIESIRFLGNTAFFDDEIEVSFFAVPFSEWQTPYQTVTFNFDSELYEGGYQVYYAQDGAFMEAMSHYVPVVPGHQSVTFTIPSVGWNTLRLDFPNVEGNEFNLTSIEIDGKELAFSSEHNAECEVTDDGFHIVTGEYDPYVVFSEK